MNKRMLVIALILPTLIIGIFPGQIIPQGRAAVTGLVCIASVSDVLAGACPASAPSFNGPLTSPSTLLRVPVMISSTDTFNGFDITVNSTRDTGGHLVLKPYGVDLSGNVAPANSIPLAECAGSITLSGAPGSCAVNATIDNPTTVRAAEIFPSFLPIGTTGLLFTALFRINGTSLPGGVTIGFQNHCDPYPSASATDHLCVSIANGSVLSAPENVQTGGFDNSATATLPYITLSTSTLNLGQALVGSTLPTVTYTATSQNNFQTSTTPQVALSVAFNGTGPNRPTAALNMSSLDLTGLAAHPFKQTGNVPATAVVGTYLSTVLATYTTADMITFTTDSLSAIYPLSLNVTDYVFGISATTVAITPPGTQPVTATVTPKASFNNPVKLGVTIPAATASAGIGATFNSYTISGGSGSSTLTITTSVNTPGGTFTLTVTSNSTLNGFTITHTKVITITTVGFTISASKPPAQPVGTAATSTITVTYFNGLSGTVALTNNTATNLTCVPITPPSLTATGTASLQCNSLVRGVYTLTVTGTIGSNVISISATFNFTILIHDVVIGTAAVVTPSSSTTVGNAVTVSVTVQNKGAQSENVTVYLLADNLTITSKTLVIAANSNQNFMLTWDTTSSTAKTYKLSVNVQLPSGETNVENGQQTISGAAGSYTLNSANQGPSYDLTTIAIIAGLVVAIVIVATLLVLRMRKKSSASTQPGNQ